MGDVFNISKQESERIDVVKVFMCIAVLFIHSYSSQFDDSMDTSLVVNLSNYISKVLCDCAVPSFTLFSSILLYKKEFDWRINAKKKIGSLLIPYFIFNIFWIIAMIGKDVICSTEVECFSYGIIDWIDAFFGIQGEFKPALSVLWYVRDLFILNLLSNMIKKAIDRFPRFIFVLTCVIWFSGIEIFVVHTYAVVFWIFGYYIVKYNMHMDMLDRLSIGISTVIYMLCSAVVFVIRTGIILQVFIIISILYVMRLSKYLVPMNSFLRMISPATFFIYLTHKFVFYIISFIYPLTLSSYSVMYFLKPIIALFICLAIFYGMKFAFPRLISVLIGGRVSSAKEK